MLPIKKAIKKGQIFTCPLWMGNGNVKLGLSISDETVYRPDSLQPQHLYLISDEPYEKDDLCLVDTKEIGWVRVKEDAPGNLENHKKVIASTDPKLCWAEYDNCDGTEEVPNKRALLPTFSEDFIKAYVKANGEIDEINVEYEEKSTGFYKCSGCGRRLHFINESDGCDNCGSYVEEKEYHKVLKTRDDNTVIVSPAKTYTQEELEEYLQKFGNYILDNVRLRDYGGTLSDGKAAEWLADNI